MDYGEQWWKLENLEIKYLEWNEVWEKMSWCHAILNIKQINTFTTVKWECALQWWDGRTQAVAKSLNCSLILDCSLIHVIFAPPFGLLIFTEHWSYILVPWHNLHFLSYLLHTNSQIVTIARASANSRAPSRALQFNLTLECLGKVNNQKLNETAAQCDASEDIEIPLGPCSHNLNAARCPDFLRSKRHRLRLDAIAAHDVDEARWDVSRVDATAKIRSWTISLVVRKILKHNKVVSISSNAAQCHTKKCM